MIKTLKSLFRNWNGLGEPKSFNRGRCKGMTRVKNNHDITEGTFIGIYDKFGEPLHIGDRIKFKRLKREGRGSPDYEHYENNEVVEYEGVISYRPPQIKIISDAYPGPKLSQGAIIYNDGKKILDKVEVKTDRIGSISRTTYGEFEKIEDQDYE